MESGIPFSYRQLCLCLTLALFTLGPAPVAARPSQDPVVTVQLRWHHQFQFAGYYAALEKGFYKEEGLNVQLRAGEPDRQPVAEVLSGRAQYAEGNSEILYQRLLGKPLIALAAIFQHSPSVLIALEKSGIRSAHDLIGKKVMLANKNEDADFLTMLLNEGISLSQVDIVPSSYQIEDLISGKVDAFNSYMTNEPYFLKQNNIPYNIIDPLTYRVDFYSDVLFTSEQELGEHPQRVEAMLRATLKGWRYAMDHPDEIIELLKTKYQVNKSREHLRYEAEEMRKLIVPNLVEIGHMNPGRWQHMANSFVKSGLVPNQKNFDGFLYSNIPHRVPDWVIPALIIAFVIIIVTNSVALYLHQINRRLTETRETLFDSEQRFKALSEATYGGIIIHNEGSILECNKSLSDITGFSHSELLEMNCYDLIVGDGAVAAIGSPPNDSSCSNEAIGIRKDGSRFPLAIKGKSIIYQGEKARVIEIIDITERKKSEEQLKLAASVFSNAREGIMITDPEGVLIEVNDTFSQISGYSREEVIGKNPRFLNSGLQDKTFFTDLWNSLLEKKVWSGELWNRRKDGEIYVQLSTISAVTDNDGKTTNYVALFSDITEKKEYEQQLEHSAYHDTLTNLPNRMLLTDRLYQAIGQCERRGNSLAIAYLDLDGFKSVNDTYGHDAGDEVLIRISARMNKCLRNGDTLARIGGDEFVAILIDIDSIKDCELVLDRLLKASTTPLIVRGWTLQLSTSIGVTFYPQDQSDPNRLIRHADHAMYVAKQNGKNRYHFYERYLNMNSSA